MRLIPDRETVVLDVQPVATLTYAILRAMWEGAEVRREAVHASTVASRVAVSRLDVDTMTVPVPAEVLWWLAYEVDVLPTRWVDDDILTASRTVRTLLAEFAPATCRGLDAVIDVECILAIADAIGG